MKKYIGDKKFYKMVLILAIPVMIQNGITNFVSLLDNIMVGQVGTEQMSGVAIVNQLIFVYNLCIFGIVSGASIFGTQFYGKGNYEGMKNAFRFKIISCIIMSGIGIFILYGFQTELISLYLHEGSGIGDINAAFNYAREYLLIMLTSLVPFAISQVYSSTLREMGKTVVPMIAGIVAVFVNMVLNYILIFGKFGAPVLGVQGAAIATVIAKYMECIIIVTWVHRHAADNKFIIGAYQSFAIPRQLVKQIMIKGAPLMVNEALWASGMAIIMQCYSIRGLEVIAGMNISTTISNMFNIVFIALGSSVAIIIGQLLGANKMDEAKDTDAKLIFFSVVSCIFIGIIMAIVAPLFPAIYKTSDEVKYLASRFIMVAALCMPINAFTHASYFTLRSGGKTIITFLFDSVFVWVISIPAAYFLTRFSDLHIIMVYLICQLLDIIKCIIGYILIKKGVWLQNIVV
ncbi:putative MATE family efflux protein [Lachnotalea glycerini]|uniref:Probable multidrug resistance protein NorM n=1 Tax=Lachnotalea glycerini TaxID=1763509 RepID=A0A255ISN6_9FIRM|nr:MATE family efflux transporter [Lachnotalea glycerini]PXV87329.1 putative MATE family efflux protein [Lachnotalea glycerini]RDY27514.1 MATE family efflux transporter [Lachnotalea glycerini]